jgi:hypothetical protein
MKTLAKQIIEDMALAPVDLFGTIKPVVPTAIGGFEGLRVDNRSAGLAVAAFEDAEVAAQHIIDAFPGAVKTPLPEIVRDDAPGWQIIGDKPPRTAGAQDL